MKLFSNDTVRQNLVKILNDKAKTMGLTAYQLQALAWVNIRIRYGETSAKFAKFEDVMDYAREAANGIANFDAGLGNSIVQTIRILASGPRFKFTKTQDVVDTIQNRDKYSSVFFLPPKNDVEKKKARKIAMSNEQLRKMRIALSQDGTSADIFDLATSKKDPRHKVTGVDRRNTLKNSLEWVMQYQPTTGAAIA